MKLRRIVAIALVVLGGVLIFFAPETLGGIILVLIGVTVEVVGIVLERKR